MEETQLLLLAVGLIVGITAITLGRRWFASSRPKAQCAHCSSTTMKEINRETFDSRTLVFGNGGRTLGGDVRLQLDQEVTYHCNSCHKESKVKVTKTQ